MAITLVSQASSRFESQFFVNAIVPTSFFLPLVTGVVVHSLWGLPTLIDEYTGLPVAFQIAVPAVAVGVTWLVAAIVASQWSNIVRVFEGYPLIRLYDWLSAHRLTRGMAQRIGILGAAAHHRRRDGLAERAREGTLVDTALDLNYDTVDDFLLPTRLGNILHSAEMYSYHRYGIDHHVFWTRIAMKLPSHLMRDIESLVSRYQLPLVVAAWSVVLSLSSVAPALRGERGLFWAALWGGATLTLVAYRMSLSPAQHYGIALRAAFDTYRNSLKEHWSAADDPDAERQYFQRLRAFILTGDADAVRASAPRRSMLKDMDPSSELVSPVGLPGRVSAIMLVVCTLAWAAGTAAIAVQSTNRLIAVAETPAYGVVGEIARVDGVVPVASRLGALTEVPPDAVLIALEALDADTVLTQANVVVALFEPKAFVTVEMTTAAVDQIGLGIGGEVQVTLTGPSDFESDERCRRLKAAGASRSLLGQVLAVTATNDGGVSVLVGLPGTALDVVSCYDLNGAVLNPGIAEHDISYGLGAD